jgi:uncharacterized protein (DUF952 family)
MDLVVITVDSTPVQAPVRWESPPQSNETLPHIYGPLNLNAITGVPTLRTSARSTFEGLEPFTGNSNGER